MIPIIDTGHGYNTPGKRSIYHKDSEGRELLRENCVNEAVGNKLAYMFWLNGEQYHFITNEWYDVPLSERVVREHQITKRMRKLGKKSFLISIHADAFHQKDKAKGGRFFYFSESGKKLADHFTNYLRECGYPLSLRPPMKANFKMLTATMSPAILFEMGFMTTKSDLDYLLKDSFRNKTTELLYEATMNYED